MFKSIRSYIAAAAIAIASIATTTDVNAQIMRSEDASTSPREMTFGVGGGVNLNMAGGDFNPMQTGPSSYGVGDYHTPSFHAELEVPITSNLRGAARVSYNDLSSVIDDDASGNTVAQSDMRAFSYRTVGTDLMAKYTVIDNLHLIGGGGHCRAAVENVDRAMMGEALGLQHPHRGAAGRMWQADHGARAIGQHRQINGMLGHQIGGAL